MTSYVALDLGAESGRVILGTLANGRLSLEEIHRFANGSILVDQALRWDLPHLTEEIKKGLRKLAARGTIPHGISADSWGVDYVYLREGRPLPDAPYHYRDSRTDAAMEAAFSQMSREAIFEETGIQFRPFNTLYQLLADQATRPQVAAQADRFLCMADYFNYLLSNRLVAEESLASTTQLYNSRSRTWSGLLIGKFGLREEIFPPVVPAGTLLGSLNGPWAKELGWTDTRIIATCSHDTGAAVAAVPAEGEDWAFLSSGTWSLLGLESPVSFIHEESRRAGCTNEVGLRGRFRFLKNIVGLWIVQECRRSWSEEGHPYSYDELTRLADEAEPLRSFIHPDEVRFYKPGHMPDKVAAYCAETGQPAPGTHGAVIRCVLESLALLYQATLLELEKISRRKISCLHIVGGGSQNDLLNQLTANAAQRPVMAGPVEATAVGNLLVQALALGHIKSPEDIRRIVKDSFPLKIYEPRDAGDWKNAFAHFQKLEINHPKKLS